MKGAYYNEFDPYAAQWLRNLIAAGHIAPGEVDERSIKDVHADDLKGFVQCHFFAGIGVWSHALRNAGWDDSRPVWTGSCPCQPFSAAGKQSGVEDERHLWPAFFKLIDQRKPAVVFGEQVEAAIRHGWLDLVQADMEGIGYAFAAAGIPAAGVGAPHIRQRLWFVADSKHDGRNRPGRASPITHSDQSQKWVSDGNSSAGRLAYSDSRRLEQDAGKGLCTNAEYDTQPFGLSSRLGNNNNKGLEGLGGGHSTESGRQGAVRPVAEAGEFGGMADAFSRLNESSCAQPNQRPVAGSDGTMQTEPRPAGPTNGHWRDADWLGCRDGKWRPVEPGTFPLVNGASARVGRLRAYGNAITAQVGREFIQAYMSVRP